MSDDEETFGLDEATATEIVSSLERLRRQVSRSQGDVKSSLGKLQTLTLRLYQRMGNERRKLERRVARLEHGAGIRPPLEDMPQLESDGEQPSRPSNDRPPVSDG